MKTRIYLVIVIIIVAVAILKANNASGSNYDARSLGFFDEVACYGSFSVELVQDTISYAVIYADSMIAPYIQTEIIKNRLCISWKDKYKLKGNLKPVISVHTSNYTRVLQFGSGIIFSKNLKVNAIEFTIAGSGNIMIDSLQAFKVVNCVSGSGDIHLKLSAITVESSVSGTGNINLSGETERSLLKVYGSGNLFCSDLKQIDCSARIYGSGNVYINASRLIDFQVYGSGNIYYKGNPSLTMDTYGSGKAIQIK